MHVVHGVVAKFLLSEIRPLQRTRNQRARNSKACSWVSPFASLTLPLEGDKLLNTAQLDEVSIQRMSLEGMFQTIVGAIAISILRRENLRAERLSN